ncbi:MAG: hypothetical protein KGH94_03920 [Candidatus Micrarchaeota archaeon]|nr:hypothetical protein [Candidatus Micrarchaeota archaeon]
MKKPETGPEKEKAAMETIRKDVQNAISILNERQRKGQVDYTPIIDENGDIRLGKSAEMALVQSYNAYAARQTSSRRKILMAAHENYVKQILPTLDLCDKIDREMGEDRSNPPQ